MPFEVDSFYRIKDGLYGFTFSDRVKYEPDYEIGLDGTSYVTHTSFSRPNTTQSWNVIFRNIVVSAKHKRILCIDRMIKLSQRVGLVYVMQSDQRRSPLYSVFHYDVTDPRNMEAAGAILDGYRDETLRRYNMSKSDELHVRGREVDVPMSQDEYWELIFFADSLSDAGEKKAVLDKAFGDDRYIFGMHLSGYAAEFRARGDNTFADQLLEHRVELNPDFYDDSTSTTSAALADTFAVRKSRYAYNLPLKKRLEGILETDQRMRTQWRLAVNNAPDDTRRNEYLRALAYTTDSLNLIAVENILAAQGYPSVSSVGQDASSAVWLVIQHADLDTQERFLPQLEEAAARGDILPGYIAALKDRIDVREGRPQKYGTQYDADGKLYPLLDAQMVDQWRAEVGLPPLQR